MHIFSLRPKVKDSELLWSMHLTPPSSYLCLPTYVYLLTHVYLPTYLPTYLPMSIFLAMSIFLPMSTYLPMSFFLAMSIFLAMSTYLPMSIFLPMSTYLSLYNCRRPRSRYRSCFLPVMLFILQWLDQILMPLHGRFRPSSKWLSSLCSQTFLKFLSINLNSTLIRSKENFIGSQNKFMLNK